ncbi:MAG: hypothetical protein Q7J31_14165, partial [Syntrophales bacterium]|nr:hypothetical protein [Syntrophales bacterium]
PLLTQSDLKSQPILLPSTTALKSFNTIAKKLYDRLDASLNEIRTLAALRDTLLPKLITGELRVSNAERIVGKYD